MINGVAMPESDLPLVSIATPVYNCEKYVKECIDSILNQTYQNWEYVIVDNCSTDRSLEIIRECAGDDPRIRIIVNDVLLKPLPNHNSMLRKISDKSRYCKIVHSDDWLFPECIEKMVSLAEQYPNVGIVGSYRLVGEKVKSVGLPYTRSVIPGAEMARMNLLDGPYTFGSPTALLLRSDLIRARHPFYNESHPSADTEVCYDLLQNCDFGFVHQVLPFERVHPESISSGNLQLNTDIANLLVLFKKYGPIFLTEEEYSRIFSKKLREYYRFLGSRIINLNDKKFWKFHSEALARIGIEMNWFKVLVGSLYSGLRGVLALRKRLN